MLAIIALVLFLWGCVKISQFIFVGSWFEKPEEEYLDFDREINQARGNPLPYDPEYEEFLDFKREINQTLDKEGINSPE